MSKIRWLRWLLVITIVCFAILTAGYRLTHIEPETVVAAPVVSDSTPHFAQLLDQQAMTVEEVEARSVQLPAEQQQTLFEDDLFGYQVSYPQDWQKTTLSSNVVLFEAPDRQTQVKVESVGPLPADGLTPFVDRSLSHELIVSRQLLTIHGLPAERVIMISEQAGGQVTKFFIESNTSAYVVTGVGEQHAIEMVARSFSGSQLLALQ